jgi:hypothetical protein
MVTFEGMEQQRSSSGASLSPRSPSSSQPFLSVSVSDPVKLGNGVQAYISYRVITKVFLSLIHFVIFDFFFCCFFLIIYISNFRVEVSPELN